MKSRLFFFVIILMTVWPSAGFSETASPKTASSSGIPVLMYHEIISDNSKKPGSWIMSLDKFEEQMKFLKDNGYQTLGFDEFIQVLRREKKAPEKAVVLTFDDGWKSVLQVAPVLERYGFKASFWIIAGDKGIGGPYMDWKDIEALDRNPLFQIGSHSISHPYDINNNLTLWVDGDVPGKGEADARFELQESKRLLEKHLGHPVRYFAWPCGWYNRKLIQLAHEAGYEALLTIRDGLNFPGSDVRFIQRTIMNGTYDIDTFSAQLKDGLD